jgi:hypothetical protein
MYTFGLTSTNLKNRSNELKFIRLNTTISDAPIGWNKVIKYQHLNKT